MSKDAILNQSEPNWTKLNRTANVFGLSKSRLKSTNRGDDMHPLRTASVTMFYSNSKTNRVYIGNISL